MAETQIHAGGTSAAPLVYNVSSTEEFTLLAVNATFDGSGAGTAWLPAVEVVSDSGQVIARHITGATVAAGGSAEATFAPFLRTTRGAGGGGWQYNIDNTGGWGLLETAGAVGLNTSQPSSFVPGDDPSIASLAVNSQFGSVFTNDPTSSLPVVIIEAGVGATATADALDIRTDSSGGTGPTEGIHGDVNSGSGAAQGIALGVSAATGQVSGVDVQAAQLNGAGTASTVAVKALASSRGTGDTIGLQGQSHAFGAGKACALRCLDHTGATIFEVRDDGSIHGLAAVGAITWDL